MMLRMTDHVFDDDARVISMLNDNDGMCTRMSFNYSVDEYDQDSDSSHTLPLLAVVMLMMW